MEDIRLFPVTIGTRAMHEDLPEEDDDKYWIRIAATNGERDLHNSIMDPKTTLKNFEKEAKMKPGVALKDHHGYKSFGYGRSADAKLTDKNELMIDFFILKNMEYSDSSLQFKSSALLIRALEHDLVNQASVGFFGAREVCNLCNLPIRRYSYWDWEPEREGQCTHKMGKKYENKDGKMETATYTVYDAHLKEVSLVEFGSNRHTAIEKQREMRSFMEEFLMTDQEWITKLRDVLDIPDIGATDEPDAVVQKLQGEVKNLREKDSAQKQTWVVKLRDALGLKDVRSTDEPDTVLGKVTGEVTSLREQVETQKDEIADLTASAKDGEAYREARIEEAIKQGNRAYGDDFDEEYHREYYADMPLEKLEAHIAQNRKKGDAALPAGRSTTEGHEPPPEAQKMNERRRRRRLRRKR